MRTKRCLMNAMTGAALLGVLSLTTSCGTLLYPERRGQKGGQIDPTVVILNGVGCLLFLIPGLIAFAVDFSNGTIYLPPEGGSTLHGARDLDDMVAVKVEGDLDMARIEKVLRRHTGHDVDLTARNVRVVRLDAASSPAL